MGLDGQFHRTPRHRLHGVVLIPERDNVGNRYARRRGNIMFGDVDGLHGITKNADIHCQNTPTSLLDHRGKKCQFILFGVIGADQQYGFRFHGWTRTFFSLHLAS